MSESTPGVEERVLHAMKRTLTQVIKDTATEPGMIHPLKPETIDMLRDCLVLISAREQELAAAAGRTSSARPRYVDEPQAPEVGLGSLKRNKSQ
jgi:hypothetical protein